MGHDRCCVGACDNNRRYPDKLILPSNVTSVTWHRFPKNDTKRKRWVKLISKGRTDFEQGNCSRMYLVHFPDGKAISSNPNPTLFLTIQDNREKGKKYQQFQKRKSPLKRPISGKVTNSSFFLDDDKDLHGNEIKERSDSAPIPLAFEYFTLEHVSFCTVLAHYCSIQKCF